MNIMTACAEYLNHGLIALTKPDEADVIAIRDTYAAGADLINAKSYIFNACTVAFITSIFFGLSETISAMKMLTLCATFYIGRKMAEESFNITVPNLVKYFAPNILKPNPSLTFDKIVIFYEIIPRTLPS